MFNHEKIMIKNEAIYCHYENTGRPKVLFLHGFNSSHSFTFQIDNIKDRKYDIVSFDFPGAGKSTSNEKIDIKYYQEIALEVAKHFKIEESLVVGHSLGAASALYILEQKWAKKALLVAPLNPYILEEAIKNRVEILKNWLLPVSLSDAVESMKSLVFGNKNNYKDQVKKIGALFFKISQTKYKLLAPMVNKQILNTKWLKENLLPLYASSLDYEIISGKQDLFVPIGGLEKLASDFSKKITILDKCGHATFFEKPEEINEKIHEIISTF
ncbi:esterase/lipase [Mesomycoplasma conjunctivae]|uniref:AB hydrolase-1 domain-containing protein n=1 Tax=Mesomycoplasma conjunctivae (strain ATCC 25834 / NCTC 10147 / HRC/581) TaxID=572263 RepID=C5J6I4_MESCH|nr:alpha/beta hydrolase [Mesomycoplasma conjunctivae]CAT05076.1 HYPOTHETICAL PROTEIN MCJ_003880 [Mesomycoplasma conjunctivae]VEU66267.1 esterase/lipase [Mesomycoplasma conjunctivae]